MKHKKKEEAREDADNRQELKVRSLSDVEGARVRDDGTGD